MPLASARKSACTQSNATLVMMLASQFCSGNNHGEKKAKLRRCYDSLSHLRDMSGEHTQLAEHAPAFVGGAQPGGSQSWASRHLVANLPHINDNLLYLDRIEYLTDAEILDLLFAYAPEFPQETGLAQRLLSHFGDLGHVVTARASELHAKGGLTGGQVFVLKLFALSAQRLTRARLRNMPIISGSQALLDYCHASLGYRESEQFRVLFLDRKNRLIADEVLGEGTVDHVAVYPREVIRRALELNASALILVHNHPSGDPTPSEADIAMTHAIEHVSQALSITLHDHLIIGKSCEVSFRAEGLMSG